MPSSRQHSPAPTSVRDLDPASARRRILPGSAMAAVVLFGLLSLGAGALSWSRTDRLEREGYPSLRNRRQLWMWAGEARFAVQVETDGDRGARLAHADSIVERFHQLAGEVAGRDDNGHSLRRAEDQFAAWYVQARRGETGVPSSGGAAGSSAEGGAPTFRQIDEQLAGEVVNASRAIERDSMIAERARNVAWSLLGLALVSLAHGLATGRAAGATLAVRAAGGRGVAAPAATASATASATPPRLTAWTQPVRAATPTSATPTRATPVRATPVRATSAIATPGEMTCADAGSAAASAPTPKDERRATSRYVPTWGAASSLVPGSTDAAGASARPVALYDAIRLLERVLRDTAVGMERAEAPLALARANTQSTASAAKQLAATASSLAEQAMQLQALLGSFRVRGAAAAA